MSPSHADDRPGPDRVSRPPTGRSATRHMDPAGKAALFSSPPVAARDQLGTGNQKEGRAAFFSTGPRQTGTVVVECAACGSRSRVSLVDLGVRLVSISLWIPARRHGHWMRCPACDTHTWCRIGWNE